MTDAPILLAFDTSGPHCAAALGRGAHLWASRREEMTRGQAERLMPMIAEMLDAEGVSWSDLGLIAVGTGPGNFTGTRIAVSAARGLALSLGIPAMGVSRFEVMRGPASTRDTEPQLVCLAGPGASVDVTFVQYFSDGRACDAPFVVDTQTYSPPPDRQFLPQTLIIGENTALVSVSFEIAHKAHPRLRPRYRTRATVLPDIAPTIVRIAQARFAGGETMPSRPAPVYVRPPDAAPPRYRAPVILP